MSHFLSRLAARAVAAPTVVRPQLPSLFEPVKAPEAFPVPRAPYRMDADQPELEQDVSFEKPASSAAVSRPGDPATPSPSPLALPRQQRAPQPRTRAQSPPRPSDVFPLEVEVNAADSPVPQERVDAPLQDPGFRPAQVVSVAAPQTAPAAEADSPDRRQVETTAARQSKPVGVERDDLRVVTNYASSAPVPAPPSAPLPTAAPAQLAPVRGPANTPFACAVDQSAAPAVHVTIGRVKVRAILPPAPVAPATPRRTPKLSLDEYLRSRTGGGGA